MNTIVEFLILLFAFLMLLAMIGLFTIFGVRRNSTDYDLQEGDKNDE